VAQYINYVFLHLWNLLTCAMLALLLLLFANGAYPLQPQQLLNAFLFAIAVTVVGWTLRVLVQINRNDLLSRIQKTEPNKTTFDRPLVAQFLLYGVVPLHAPGHAVPQHGRVVLVGRGYLEAREVMGRILEAP
jgi:hypothetical protein